MLVVGVLVARHVTCVPLLSMLLMALVRMLPMLLPMRMLSMLAMRMVVVVVLVMRMVVVVVAVGPVIQKEWVVCQQLLEVEGADS